MALVLPGGETKPRPSAPLESLPCIHCGIPIGEVGGGSITMGTGGPWVVCRRCVVFHEKWWLP